MDHRCKRHKFSAQWNIGNSRYDGLILDSEMRESRSPPETRAGGVGCFLGRNQPTCRIDAARRQNQVNELTALSHQRCQQFNNRSDTIGEPRNAPIAGTVMALRKGDINSSTFCLFSASTMATKV